MGTVDMVATLALGVARLAVFALALGLTLISFRAYREKKSDRLESAFIGFAFLSMGVALTTLSTQMETWTTVFELVETIPLVIGFSMLYISLYR
jgi:multisubunit Na+/H+ antiporter MnhB subunit